MTADAIPATLPEVYARLREIAPEPDPESPDVAAQLSRWLLVAAQRRFNHCVNPDMPTDEALSGDALSALAAQFAAAHLLAYVAENDTDSAARLSREITYAWADGGGIGEWLWEHAQKLGIDTDEVNALADAEARLRKGASDARSDADGRTEAPASVETPEAAEAVRSAS
jgi:hypothetical protein